MPYQLKVDKEVHKYESEKICEMGLDFSGTEGRLEIDK